MGEKFSQFGWLWCWEYFLSNETQTHHHIIWFYQSLDRYYFSTIIEYGAQGRKKKVDMLYYWSDVTQVVKNYTWKTSCTIYKRRNWVFQSLFIIHIFPILLCVYLVRIKIILKVCFRKNPLHTRGQGSCERLVCRMVHIAPVTKRKTTKLHSSTLELAARRLKFFYLPVSSFNEILRKIKILNLKYYIYVLIKQITNKTWSNVSITLPFIS